MAFPLLNVRFILLISASFVAIFSSIAIYFCLPILISHVLRTQLSLSTTSGSFDGWRLNSVIDWIYLYNITNLNDLVSDASNDKVKPPSERRAVPKLKQIGPIVFRQDREKLNIVFDPKNETVIYDQKKSWTFLPELSAIKTINELNSTMINHISVPLAGTTLTSPEYSEFIEPIVAEFGLELFLTHSFNTLLFEGYSDILMEQAKANRQVDVDRFGWMHNQNNSITRNIRIFTGPSNATLDKLGSIDEFDHSKQINVWHNDNTDAEDYKNVTCNEFRFSSPGELFPPPESSIMNHNNQYRNYYQQAHNRDLIAGSNRDEKAKKHTLPVSKNEQVPTSGPLQAKAQHSETDELKTSDRASSPRLELREERVGKSISIFMNDLCRVFRLYYAGSYYFKSLLVDRYLADKSTYDYTSETLSDGSKNKNKCYCTYNATSKSTSCPPNGMMDLYDCKKGSPLTVSFPHFLYSKHDKTLSPYLELFELIDDNKSAALHNLSSDDNQDLEHLFFVDLETTLNVPVNVQIVLQFNVHFKKEPSFRYTQEYSYLFDRPTTMTDKGADTSVELRDLYLPQMWIKSTAEVDEKNLRNLLFIQKHLDLITPLTTITIFGFASILLLMSARLAYNLFYGPMSRRKSSLARDEESCSSLARINHSSSFLNDKDKKYAKQLLAGSDKLAESYCLGQMSSSSAATTTSVSKRSDEESSSYKDQPTTSASAAVENSESQPLNVTVRAGL